LPSRSEEVNLKTGEVIGGGEWTSITANTLHNATIFEPPSVHPTGSTAVVLEMLQSVADATPEQMMSRTPGSEPPTKGAQADVTYDMNWLGYELLKVDKYDHALAVFHQIIAENPSSARLRKSGRSLSAAARQGECYFCVPARSRSCLKGDDVPGSWLRYTARNRDSLAPPKVGIKCRFCHCTT